MSPSVRPLGAHQHFFSVRGGIAGVHLRGRSNGRAQAFTILELLVGFAVLAVLVTLLTAAFSNFSQMASTSTRRMEVNKQPRAMFDRLGFDIGSAVNSGGIRMEFRKNETLPERGASKNDALILLTDAKSPDATGRMANVGYAVGPYRDRSRNIEVDTVMRYVQALRWSDDTTKIDVSNAKTDSPPISAQPIAPGILRFELSFAMQNGDILARPPTDSEALDEFYENLASVIVTVATLDEDSLQKLTASERASIVNRLNDVVDNQPILPVWQAVDFSGLPPVKQGLKFHQRYFRVKP